VLSVRELSPSIRLFGLLVVTMSVNALSIFPMRFARDSLYRMSENAGVRVSVITDQEI
jgi:hypothetical protein